MPPKKPEQKLLLSDALYLAPYSNLGSLHEIAKTMIEKDDHSIVLFLKDHKKKFVKGAISSPNEIHIDAIIFSLYEKYGGKLFDFIDELESAENPGVIDLTYVDPETRTNIMVRALYGNDLETLAALIKKGIDLEAKLPIFGSTALMYAIETGKEEIMAILLEAGALCDAINDSGENSLMVALRTGQEDLALVFAEELMKSEADRNHKNLAGEGILDYAEMFSCRKFLGNYLRGDQSDFSKMVNARKLLRLMHSQDDAGGKISNVEFLQKFFQQHPFPNAEFSKILQAIQDGKMDFGDGRRIEIIDMPFLDHQAFMVVEYRADKAVEVSYCDSNLPLSDVDRNKHGFGEVCFEVASDFANPDLGKKLAEYYKKHLKTFCEEDGRLKVPKFLKSLGNFAKNKDEKGQAVMSKRNILTKVQDRGNCSMKSLNIALRAIMKKLHPELTFEKEVNDVFVSQGNGYEEYKKYKNFVIDECLNDVLEVSRKIGNDRGNSCYSIVIDCLKSSLLQAASKKDRKYKDRSLDGADTAGENQFMIQRIVDELRQKGFTNKQLSEIKNSKGENIFYIAVKSGSDAAANWCVENGITLSVNAAGNGVARYVLENSAMTEFFLQNFKSKKLKADEQVTLEVAFLATTQQQNHVVIDMIDSGLDVFLNDARGSNLVGRAFQDNPELLALLLEQNKFFASPDLLTNLLTQAAQKLKVFTEQKKSQKEFLDPYKHLIRETVLGLQKETYKPLSAKEILEVSLSLEDPETRALILSLGGSIMEKPPLRGGDISLRSTESLASAAAAVEYKI